MNQRKGGFARSRALSPARRSAIAKKAAQARWRSKKPDLERFSALVSSFCDRHKIKRVALFGSVLTNKFGPDSDVDVLVDFDKGASLLDAADAQEELVNLWKRKVDLVSRSSVLRDEYAPRRDSILSNAKVIYVRS